jgi:hypothetical protein
MKAILLSTFFGPVQWYQKLNRYEEVYLESDADSYMKQSYRNRCLIATTNGVQALTVPVSVETSPYGKTVRISDHGNWRHQHWQALTSAYGDSPFFQYYEDDLRPFFTERWEFLLDYNEAIRQRMCVLLDVLPKVFLCSRPTIEHEKKENIGDFADFREVIDAKHPLPDATFQPRRYYQVYERKHGFLPNLSVLDLLFNMGPEGIFYL